MNIDELENKIEEIKIQIRGWGLDNTHPEKARILGSILAELKYWECKLALKDPDFMLEYPLNNTQCLEYVNSFNNMKQELEEKKKFIYDK